MTISSAEFDLQQMRSTVHTNCVVCSSSNERGLRLEFVELGNGEVQAIFDCAEAFEGYAGMLHGGVVASLVDGAMTNCVFARGVSAVTAELTVRFRRPVITGAVAMVRAWIDRSKPPLYLVRAEIVQDRQAKVTASGKFVKQASSTTGGSARGLHGRRSRAASHSLIRMRREEE